MAPDVGIDVKSIGLSKSRALLVLGTTPKPSARNYPKIVDSPFFFKMARTVDGKSRAVLQV